VATFWNTLSLTTNIGTNNTFQTGTAETASSAINRGPFLPASSATNAIGGTPWPDLFYLNDNTSGKDTGLYKYTDGVWSLKIRVGSAPDLYLGQQLPLNISEGTYALLSTNNTINKTAGVYRYENSQWSMLETYGADGLSLISNALPTTHLTGGAAGAAPASIIGDAATIYPTQFIDPAKRPTGFSLAPASLTTNEFLNWNSTIQRDYILSQGFSVNGSTLKQGVTIGPAGAQATAFLSADDGSLNSDIRGQKIYIVENIQSADVGVMSLADQERLATLNAWSNTTSGVAARLGFTPTGTVTSTTISSTRNTLKSLLDGYKNQMPAVTGGISSANAALFTKQIDNLKARLDMMGVFNELSIKSVADAIKDRYTRAASFALQSDNTKITNATQIYGQLKNNVVSTDSNKTITEGFEKFIATEKRLTNLDNARLAMSKGVAHLARTDLPRLVFMMQVNYQLSNKQISEGDQEELRQQNAYLKDISIFQADLQTTLALFGTASDEKHAFLGYETPADSHVDNVPYRSTNPFNSTRQAAFSMFADELSHTNGQHPIQDYRDLPDRPTVQMLTKEGTTTVYAFTSNLKTYWDAIVTKVNDHTTLVQQQGTAVQNTITNKDKEATRHYELATNVLTKMFETVTNITRSS